MDVVLFPSVSFKFSPVGNISRTKNEGGGAECEQSEMKVAGMFLTHALVHLTQEPKEPAKPFWETSRLEPGAHLLNFQTWTIIYQKGKFLRVKHGQQFEIYRLCNSQQTGFQHLFDVFHVGGSQKKAAEKKSPLISSDFLFQSHFCCFRDSFIYLRKSLCIDCVSLGVKYLPYWSRVEGLITGVLGVILLVTAKNVFDISSFIIFPNKLTPNI